MLVLVAWPPLAIHSRPGSYKRYGYGYGEIAKLVHGRSLAKATTVISHGARNAALAPVRCPDMSRGTGYTTRRGGGLLKLPTIDQYGRSIHRGQGYLVCSPSYTRTFYFEGPLPGVCVQVLREKE